MGTRNLTIVILGGQAVIAQYCQWDGYPSGQGKTILEFLRDGFNRDKFVESLKNTKVITPEDYTAYQVEVLGRDPGDMIPMDDYKKFCEAYPSLGRDLGGNILAFVQDGEVGITRWDFAEKDKMVAITTVTKATNPLPLQVDPDFANDGVWCEWVYTVNLDDNTFSVRNGGGPVIATYFLKKLPTVKTFLKRFERE